jgi:F-type H+-transporting ATPase subunit alpha
MLIFAGTRGYLDDVPVDNVSEWSRDFLRYMDTAHTGVGNSIADTFDFTDETEESLKQALSDFNASWSG